MVKSSFRICSILCIFLQILSTQAFVSDNLGMGLKAQSNAKLHFYSPPHELNATELNRPRYYADVCLNEPDSYSNYFNYTIEYGDASKYIFGEKLGQGEYAIVYAAINNITGEKVVIKVLKPTKMERVHREIMIMKILKGADHIVNLIEVIRDPNTTEPSLVMQFVESHNITFKDLFKNFTDFDVRLYTYQLLKAVDFSNSKGIFHRDIKPQNFVIDHDNKNLVLLDWGLGEFYKPNLDYSFSVATRYFKGPELLLGMKQYDYSHDVWSIGCTFGAMIFRRSYLFVGKDNYDQLEKIVTMMGTEELFEYSKKYGFKYENAYEGVLMYHKRKSWNKLVTDLNKDLAHPLAIDLLEKMMQYDHHDRILPREALDHPYFDPIKEYYRIEEANKQQQIEDAFFAQL